MLASGGRIECEVDPESLADDDIVLHLLPRPRSAACAATAMREYLKTAVRHPAGTTDRLLEADRERLY